VARTGPRVLVKIIKRHPWSSLRDALLITGFMTFAVMMARRYDLFAFFKDLADPRKGISPAEGILLGVLFALSIYLFIKRRLDEARNDADNQAQLEREIRELRELAMQDPLTKLPNRRVLLAALEAATARCTTSGQQHAFFIMDLNGFKRVNDAFGHAVGDEVLQIVAERFRRATRPTDLLARLGGDEFAVLSCNIDSKDTHAIGTRFAAALDQGIRTGSQTHDIGVAIGAALIPEQGATGEAILHNADLAMYRAKGMAHSSLALFDPAVDVARAELKAIG
jgi:diguanylate cyclase (GGDEF)-like protein